MGKFWNEKKNVITGGLIQSWQEKTVFKGDIKVEVEI